MPNETPLPTPTRDPDGSDVPVGILTVVLVYAAFSALWILLSDKALEWLLTDPAQITLASTLKGWAFVAVTSLLLYGLMRRLVARSDAPSKAVSGLRSLILPLALFAMAIVTLTAGAIAHSVIHVKKKEVARLQAIADFKTRQIEDWLGERNGDALLMQSHRFWVELYRRWRDEGDDTARALLQGRLNELRKHKSFEDALLLDEQGEPLWDSQGAPFAIDPSLQVALRKAAHEKSVIQLGPYRDAADHLHLDFVAPLPQVDGRPSPTILLRVDPAKYLFPTLKAWPVPEASSEILLVRRDGDRVLFLDELRQQPDAAAKFSLPITAKNLFAARILRGEVSAGGLLEALDYRGVPVMGVARAIHGTDWFLVAKMDKAELHGEMIRDVLWIGLAGLLALFITATGAFLFRQRQELAASVREREIQAEKLRALQLLDAISEGSADVIFAKDLEGRYLFFNREAARVAGIPSQAVLGRDDMTVFPPEQAAMVMANDRQVMTEDCSFTFQEDLTTAAGEISYLVTKGPLHDAAGHVIGVFGIARDITERRRAEEALRDSLEEKVALLQEVHHRVKNNLQIVASLLNLQASRAPNRQVADILHDTRNRVHSMALLHEALYRSENLARINFSAYVKELCTQLMRSFGPGAARVKLENHVAPFDLDLELAVPCGLIINELVSNAVKHGFADERRGRVVVELEPDDDHQVVLCVRDDGAGLPAGFDLDATSTLGLKLVSNLAGQLGGRLVLERPSDGGAVFRVVFPLAQDTAR